MEEVVKSTGIPSAEERPDLYDGYDCAPREPLSPEYMAAITPEHVKSAIALKQLTDKGTDDL